MTKQQSAEGASRWAELWVAVRTNVILGLLFLPLIAIFGVLFGLMAISIGDIILLYLEQEPTGISTIFTEDVQLNPSAVPHSIAIGTGVLLVGALLFWIDHIANQKVQNQ